MHKEHHMYVPELIFGNLLTGSNFDDDQKKTTGGRNGFGAKVTYFSRNYIKNYHSQYWQAPPIYSGQYLSNTVSFKPRVMPSQYLHKFIILVEL